MRAAPFLVLVLVPLPTSNALLFGQQVAVVEVTPPRASVTAGEKFQFHATPKDVNGNPVGGAPTEWFATPFDIAGADSTGLVTTFRPGQTYVFAVVGGKPGFAVLDIAERAPARLEISAFGSSTIVVGGVLQLAANGRTQIGDPIEVGETGTVQWRSLAPAIAQVNAGGIVTGRAPGQATIVAAAGALTARFELTIRANPVRSLRIVTPPGPVRVGDVVALRAELTGRDGRPVADVPVRWAVSGPGGAVYANGRFVGTRPHAYPITATVGDRVAYATVKVVPRNEMRTVTPVAHVPLPKDVQGGEIWPVGDVAYVSTIGSELYTFDISNPTAPRLTDSLVIDARLLNDVMTTADGKIGVITREGASNRNNGLVFFDAADPRHPKVISEFTETVSGGVHSAFVYEHYVFATDDATGSLRIIDFADPRSPKQVARWEVDTRRPVQAYAVEFLNVAPQRYLHDVYVKDGLAYLAYWRDGLVILDVGKGIKGGSITSPRLVSQFAYNHAELYPPGYIAGTHAVFPYGSYVFLGDESYSGTIDLFSREQFPTRGLLHVIDVSDLEHPREVATYDPVEFGVHNLYVEGDLCYIGAYNGGIRVLDVSGELRGDLRAQGRVIGGVHTGSLDGYRPNMALAWSAIPRNGYIFASDINTGLWVAKVQ